MNKRIVSFLTALFVLLLSFSFLAFAEVDGAAVKPDTRLVERLNDEAELIDDADEEKLLSKLDKISEEMQFDFVIATVSSTEGQDIETFSDDYFDYNGFGYGDEDDGVALVISMDPRACYISGCGEGTQYFDYDDCQEMIDRFYDDLKGGNYAKVCSIFIKDAENRVKSGRSTEVPVDGDSDDNFDDDYYDDDYSRFSYVPWPQYLLISLAVGIVLAFITVAIMKRGLKSVSMKQSAADYEVPGSMNLTRHEDAFLYSNVTKTEIPRDDDSSSSFGSSGSHTSSSGNSHSGGGRSF